MAKLADNSSNKLISALDDIANRFGCDLVSANVERDMLGTIKLQIDVLSRNALSHQGVYRIGVSVDDHDLSGSEVTFHNLVCMQVEKHLQEYFGKRKVGRNFVDQKYIEQNENWLEQKRLFQQEVVIPVERFGGMLIDKELEEEMAKRVRPTIVRQSPINTAKVRKPHCPIDKIEMQFDAAAQKFFCPEPTCHQVARPKRDSDDKQVILGRGELQVRFIIQPSARPRVILISDDNVALDLTDQIPPVVVGKLAKEFTEKYIQGNVDRMERMVSVPTRTLAGLQFTEMLLMYEP